MTIKQVRERDRLYMREWRKKNPDKLAAQIKRRLDKRRKYPVQLVLNLS